MVDIDIIVCTLSNKYREGRKNEALLGREIDNIEKQLEDRNISHRDYIYLSEQHEQKKNELFKLAKFNDGICEAREVVMNFWENK